MKNKQVKISEMDTLIHLTLAEHPEGLTFAELQAIIPDLKSGHIVSAKGKGLIVTDGEREVEKMNKSKAKTYKLVDDEVHVKPDGKPFNYTAGEKEIMEALKGFDKPVTLNDIAEALHKEKLHSGSINSLVNKKGNVAIVGEVERLIPSLTTAAVYKAVAADEADGR